MLILISWLFLLLQIMHSRMYMYLLTVNVTVPAPSMSTLSKWMQNKESRKAEILWTLRCVKKNNNSPFDQMIKLQKSTKRYFGIVILLNSSAWAKLSSPIWLPLDSLHTSKKCLQKLLRIARMSQLFLMRLLMMLYRRNKWIFCWGFGMGDKVVTRYRGSEFLGNGKAEDLLGALKDGLRDVNPKKKYSDWNGWT